MNIIGTGVAAGVAASQHQAEQVSRKQHKDQNGTADEARRVKDIVEAHLLALDEGDDSGTNAGQVRIDDHVPEHQKSPGDSIDAINRMPKQDDTELDQDAGSEKDTGPGLSHVDLTA